MSDRQFNVLILCTGNSARSVMAEAALNFAPIGGGKFNAYSAGSQPTGKVHPAAIRLLQKQGIATDNLRSKSWNEFAGANAPAMDFVFTVCGNAAKETCPVWPGVPVTAHWGVDDPAAVKGDEATVDKAFLDAFLILKRRIELFANLPLQQLDQGSLQHHADEIGRHNISSST